MSEHPTIGWVGGLSRSGQHLEEAAEKAGCQVEFHDGDVKGNRSKTLREIVRRSQALVIAVGLISHQGALTARAEAKQAGIPVVFVKKASQAQASEAFESLKQQLGTKGALARGRGLRRSALPLQVLHHRMFTHLRGGAPEGRAGWL